MQKETGKDFIDVLEQEELAKAKKIQKGKARKSMRKRQRRGVPNINCAPSRNQLKRPE